MTHAYENGGGVEHFFEARTTLRTFVTNYNYIARYDLFAANSFDCIIFGVEAFSFAGEYTHGRIASRCFNNGAFRSNVALEDCNTASSINRIFNSMNYIRTGINCIFDDLANGFARNGDAGFFDCTFDFGQFFDNSGNAAALINVDDVVGTARAEFGQVRSLLGNLVEEIQRKIDATVMSDCRKMESSVGRTADSHINSNCVFECVQGHDVARKNLFFPHFHNSFTCCFTKTSTLTIILSRNGAIARKSHTKNFCHDVHGVRGEQACARTATRHAYMFDFV